MQSFTSPFAGNMVDGLPPAIILERQKFGPKHNFSILIWRFPDGAKFIFVIMIRNSFIVSDVSLWSNTGAATG